jgi:type II secretory pathway component PulK
VNTASAEVLQAVLEMDSIATAQRIVAQRDRIPFRSLAEFTSFMPPGQSFETVQFDMKTKYFRAIGYAQFGRAEQAFEVLLRREGGRVSVVDYVVLD